MFSGIRNWFRSKKLQMAPQEARFWLDALRRGTLYLLYDSAIGYIREGVAEAGLSLADIGTSEEELEEFRLKGHELQAESWLNSLRQGTDHMLYDSAIGYIREGVAEAGLSLADIGTSEEELEEFRLKGHELREKFQLIQSSA